MSGAGLLTQIIAITLVGAAIRATVACGGPTVAAWWSRRREVRRWDRDARARDGAAAAIRREVRR